MRVEGLFKYIPLYAQYLFQICPFYGYVYIVIDIQHGPIWQRGVVVKEWYTIVVKSRFNTHGGSVVDDAEPEFCRVIWYFNREVCRFVFKYAQ